MVTLPRTGLVPEYRSQVQASLYSGEGWRICKLYIHYEFVAIFMNGGIGSS